MKNATVSRQGRIFQNRHPLRCSKVLAQSLCKYCREYKIWLFRGTNLPYRRSNRGGSPSLNAQ